MSSDFGLAEIKNEGEPMFFIEDLRQIPTETGLEIWSDNGEVMYGVLPLNSKESEIMTAMAFYRKGYAHGIEQGENQTIRKIHSALGL